MNSTEIKMARAWAKANGIAVGERGRLSHDILTAYRVAMGAPDPSRVIADTVSAKLSDIRQVTQA